MVFRFARTTSVFPADATSRLRGQLLLSEPSIMPLLLSTTHVPKAPSTCMILASESLMFATVVLPSKRAVATELSGEFGHFR
jgi:hypothetical protein